MLRNVYRQEREDLNAASEAVLRGRAEALRECIATGTPDASAFSELAKTLETLGDHDAALALLEEASESAPSPDLCIACIDALARRNRTEEAINTASRAMQRFPGDLRLRIREALTLPVLYKTSDELEYYRRRFTQHLEALDRELILDTPEQRMNDLSAVDGHLNFFLGYQNKNDRELQEQYSAFVYRILKAQYPELTSPVTGALAKSGRRIRVGYISPNLHRHAVARAFSAWILKLDRENFETFVYHIRGSEPASGDVREGCEHFDELSGDVLRIGSAIRADGLDAVIFLDVGMHPLTTQLASMRLAPVQCATWGHSVTTGSRNMDFFLSSSLMEPADADLHYTERLIRFPGIGVCYSKPLIPRAILDTGRSRFGLHEDGIVYLCSQSLFKYLPEHDDVFARIVAKVPSSQFAFLTQNRSVAGAFLDRLTGAFAQAGLRADEHCVMLSDLDFPDYWSLYLTSDIYLDSPGWSGFTTTMDAVAAGLPIVTLPDRFMRGRQTFAILTQLGAVDTIARDKRDYVAIAVRLAIDAEWRRHVVQKMSERESRLFSDTSSVAALEEFLLGVVC